MAATLPDNFFMTQEELDDVGQDTKSTGPSELTDNFFLTQVEVDAVNKASDLQRDIPTVEQTDFSTRSLEQGQTQTQAIEARLAQVPSVGSIISEEFNRFTDSYGPARELKNLIGDVASIRGASEGLKLGQELSKAVGHPLAKTALIAGTSAASVGLHQFAGEIVESVVKDEKVDYSDAFDKSVESAAWDAGGNLVLGGFGVVSRKALKMSGIEMSDAKKAAQALFSKYGTTLTRYQVKGTTGSRIIESISTLGLDVFSSVRKVGEKQQKALASEMDLLLEGAKGTDLGSKIVGIHTAALSNIRAEYGATLEAILKNAPSVNINMKGFNAWSKALRVKGAGVQDAEKAIETNDNKAKVNSILKIIKDRGTFDQIATTISDLTDIQRKAKASGDSVGSQYATEVRGRFRGSYGRCFSQLR